jgi:hypothetical protein
MADNVPITPGSGAKAASREVTYSGETAQVQVVGLATFDGADDAKTVADVSANNPIPVAAYGELIEAIEAMRFAIATLTRTIGMTLPSASGFPIMEARSPTAGNFNVTLGSTTISSGTVTTVSTVTNQSQLGGFAVNDQIPALMKMQSDNLRRNISVT